MQNSLAKIICTLDFCELLEAEVKGDKLVIEKD